VVNAAIDDGILTTYPFRRFSIKKTETAKLALSVHQLREMIHAELQSGWGYRDMFVLSFLLQGINIGDLCRLTVDCYDGERLRYRRSKTGKLYNIKVEPEAAAIIERYRGQQGKWLLNILEHWDADNSYRSKYNKRLKQLFPQFPHMSSNVALHTYATLLGEIDVPIEVISQAMGHSIGSSVTAIYIKHDQRKVDDANRRLFDWVWEKEGSR
jgi:integrase